MRCRLHLLRLAVGVMGWCRWRRMRLIDVHVWLCLVHIVIIVGSVSVR